MATAIVITDFSDTAHNALLYACGFSTVGNQLELLLVNITEVPTSYSGDGVALAAISDTVKHTTDKLAAAVERVSTSFPETAIKFKAVLGSFISSLREVIEEEKAALVMMGTPAAYGEIWAWDTNILNALTELPVPVLTIPLNVAYKAIKNVSFASIPGNLHRASPIDSIKKLIKYTGARLHVIAVKSSQHPEDNDPNLTDTLLKQLEEIDPTYHTINEAHIVAAIGRFVEEQHIDLLVVRPRKHGVWYNLFHKSYAKELARLNLIPVMALHDEWNIE